MTPIPPPRETTPPGRYRIGFVCLGNICRSPTAEVVLRARLAEAGLSDRVTVESCGTGGWHVGEPMDPRAAATLAADGYDPSHHRAQQYDDSWSDSHDQLLAMDLANLANLGGRSERVRLLGDLDPDRPDPEGPDGPEVPDPWSGGPEGFSLVLAMVERCCAALVERLDDLLEPPAPRVEDPA